jgi:lipopolysaccharide biosynthesis glycosyltransferase
MIGVMLGLGSYRDTARLSASRAERMTGLEFTVIEQPPKNFPPDEFPGYVKLALFDLVDAERVLYLDADTVVLRHWDLAALSDRDEFICVRDQFIGLYPESDVDIPRSRYFNSGMFIANRKSHEQLFDLASRLWRSRTLSPPTADQSALNYAVQALRAPVHFLPEEFNYLRAHLDNRDINDSVVVAHYTPFGIEFAHRKLVELAVEQQGKP